MRYVRDLASVPKHTSSFYWMGCRSAFVGSVGQMKVEEGGGKPSRRRSAKRRGCRGNRYRRAILRGGAPGRKAKLPTINREVSRVALADPRDVVKTNIHAVRIAKRLAYLRQRRLTYFANLIERYVRFHLVVRKARGKGKKKLSLDLNKLKTRVLNTLPDGSLEYRKGVLRAHLVTASYGWGALPTGFHPGAGSSVSTAVPVSQQLLDLSPTKRQSRGRKGKGIEVRQCFDCGLTYQCRLDKGSSDCPKCRPHLERIILCRACGSRHRVNECKRSIKYG